MKTADGKGIKFSNENCELVLKKNSRTIVSAENLYSIVYDLVTVNCALPEDWPSIRQKFNAEEGTYEIAIGAETFSQISEELIDDREYVQQARSGEYFLKTVVDPEKFVGFIKDKLSSLGLEEKSDFYIKFNRRLGQISVTLYETR